MLASHRTVNNTCPREHANYKRLASNGRERSIPKVKELGAWRKTLHESCL